jgi:hypothetical protein
MSQLQTIRDIAGLGDTSTAISDAQLNIEILNKIIVVYRNP